MAIQRSSKVHVDLKRKIAELNRVRTQMRLDILKMRSQPDYLTKVDFAETVNTLIGLEDELRELTQQFDGVVSRQDCRD